LRVLSLFLSVSRTPTQLNSNLHLLPLLPLCYIINMNTSLRNRQVFDISIDTHQQGGSRWFDDDGRLKRTGISQLLYIIFVHLLWLSKISKKIYILFNLYIFCSTSIVSRDRMDCKCSHHNIICFNYIKILTQSPHIN